MSPALFCTLQKMAAADTTESILLEAGSDPAFMKLQGDTAPLELLAEFLRCVMSEEFPAARLLCQKVLSLEPGNKTAQDFLPCLEERIQLDNELETESSSEESEEEEDDDDDDDDSDESSSGEDSKANGVDEHNTNGHHHCSCHASNHQRDH